MAVVVKQIWGANIPQFKTLWFFMLFFRMQNEAENNFSRCLDSKGEGTERETDGSN